LWEGREKAMIVTYDPLLVALSVVIAILGSYAGLRLARRLVRRTGPMRKALLSGAAVTTIRAPAGLDIGAVTAEEIAASILAEIVRERHTDRSRASRVDAPLPEEGEECAILTRAAAMQCCGGGEESN